MKTVLTAVLAAVVALGLSLPCPALAQQAKPLVKLTTTKGDIVIELDTDKAPVTAKNFLKNVQDGFYNGLIFHRVIGGFMIQGGGMDKDMREKTGRPTIQNEADNGLKNAAYTVAMARTNDPHSASTQFFINTVDNPFLNHSAKNATGWGYAVFGKVVEGKQTVDAIKAVATATRGMHQNVPVEPVVITKAEVIKR